MQELELAGVRVRVRLGLRRVRVRVEVRLGLELELGFGLELGLGLGLGLTEATTTTRFQKIPRSSQQTRRERKGRKKRMASLTQTEMWGIYVCMHVYVCVFLHL